MSEFKGTKGNWKLDINDYYPEIRVWQGNKSFSVSTYINIANGNGIFEDNSLCEENKANALLISKAPEMLEMLIELREIFDKYRVDNEQQFSKYKQPLEKLIKEATTL